MGKAGTGVEGDDVAEDDLGGSEASLALELAKNLVHFGEHFGATKLGDDEIVAAKGVAEGFGFGVGVEEEVEGKGGVLLETEEGGESEGRVHRV